jgi:hypothetical protein
MTTTNEVLVCSACFDQHRCARILDFVPSSACALCGRVSLGYLTEIPLPFDVGHSHDAGDVVRSVNRPT